MKFFNFNDKVSKFMRCVKLKFIISALVFVFSHVGIQDLRACSCAISPPPCYAYSESDAVFIGTVKEKINRPDESPYSKVEFEIDRGFKGVISKILYTQEITTSCDFQFEKGQKFLIYAGLDEKDKNFFGTSYCSRSAIYKDNLVDLDFLTSLSNSTSLYWIWGTISNYPELPIQGVYAHVVDDRKKVVGKSDKSGNLKLTVSKEGKYKVLVFPPKGTMIDFTTLINSPYGKNQQQILKKYNFEKNKPIIEYEIEVKANKCGWFNLPLQKFEKQ